MLSKDIFKKYDIRGLYPKDINEEVSKTLVKAYIVTFSPSKLVIGHDPLIGSKSIYDTVCTEFSKYGVEVYKAGEVSTPMLYFASAHFNVPQGIILTASHLGTLYTGFKIVLNGMPPTAEKILEMKENALSQEKFGQLTEKQMQRNHLTNLRKEYITKLIEIMGPIKEPTKYKIAIDASNGPNAKTAHEIFKNLGFEFMMINQEIKDSELSHETNPKVERNRQQLTEVVKSFGAQIGIIWDGDCDRAYFVDEKGSIIPPEFIGSRIGSFLVRRKTGNKMTIDVRAANAVEEELAKVGGVVKRIQAWHVPIKFEMEKDPTIVFGMETSGHYVFRDLYKTDDGLLASLVFLAAIFNSEHDFSKTLQEFRAKYKIVEEINFKTKKTESEIVSELKTLYKAGNLSEIDGISIDYPLWRANVRASRSEPIIRVNISGTSWEEIDKNFALIKQIVGGKVME